MKYEKIKSGVFLDRPNRFIANVRIGNKKETVHVKNTGRCRELLIPGVTVILAESDNADRKTKYDLIAVEKENVGLINIDSQAPNAVVKEWLCSSPKGFKNITYIKPEYKYGNSRIDFYLECKNKKVLMEVKGCTLELDGTGYFPDAPTERGVKHIEELIKAKKEGYDCYLAFVIAIPGVKKVLPNRKTHPEFAVALEKAKKSGVKILYLPCDIKNDELKISVEK